MCQSGELQVRYCFFHPQPPSHPPPAPAASFSAGLVLPPLLVVVPFEGAVVALGALLLAALFFPRGRVTNVEATSMETGLGTRGMGDAGKKGTIEAAAAPILERCPREPNTDAGEVLHSLSTALALTLDDVPEEVAACFA